MFRKLSPLFIALLAVTSALAQEPIRRTVVVRDGDVLYDDGLIKGKRAYLGLSLTQMTPELREFFGASKDSGILVSQVAADSPAAKAGVRVGDVVAGVDGKTVASQRDLLRAMKDKHAGDSVRLDVIRGKARQSIVATAEEREMPEMPFKFDLGQLNKEFNTQVMASPGWKAHVITPDAEELRTRIQELEKRLQELEKKLQK